MTKVLLLLALNSFFYEAIAMEQQVILQPADDHKESTMSLSEVMSLGDLAAVGAHLESYGDVNRLDSNGKSPLYYAVMQDDYDLIDLVINKGARVDCNERGCTSLLSLAALYKKASAFDVLFLYFFKTVDEEDQKKENKSSLVQRPCLKPTPQDAFVIDLLQTTLHALEREITPNCEADTVEKEYEEARALMWSTKAPAECQKAKIVFEKIAEKKVSLDSAILATSQLAQLYYYGWLGIKNDEKAFLYAQKLIELSVTRKDRIFVQEARAIADFIADESLLTDSRNNFQTYLFTASWHDSCEMAFFLLHNNSLIINCMDAQGSTPLHIACKQGHLNMVKLLLEKGASIDSRDKDEKTALHCAVESRALKELSLRVLRTEPGKEKENLVELLLSRGANSRAVDKDGCLPLHYAVDSCESTLVELLLTDGCEIDAKDHRGETALFKAVCGWNLKTDLSVIKLLVKHGAKMNSVTKNNVSPFFQAIWFKQKHIVAYMIEQGVDINGCNESNWSPLYYAARSTSADIVEMLLAHGARASVKPSPLEMALSSNDKKLVCALLNQLTVEGIKFSLDKLLTEAVHNGSDELVELFIEKGANLDVLKTGGIVPFNMLDHNPYLQKRYRRIMKLIHDYRTSKKKEREDSSQ